MGLILLRALRARYNGRLDDHNSAAAIGSIAITLLEERRETGSILAGIVGCVLSIEKRELGEVCSPLSSQRGSVCSPFCYRGVFSFPVIEETDEKLI